MEEDSDVKVGGVDGVDGVDESRIERAVTHLPNNLQYDQKVLDKNGTQYVFDTEAGAEVDMDGHDPIEAMLTQYIHEIGFDMTQIVNAAQRRIKTEPPIAKPLPKSTKWFIIISLITFILSFIMFVLSTVLMIAKNDFSLFNVISALLFLFLSIFGSKLSWNYRKIWVQPPKFIMERVEQLSYFNHLNKKERSKSVFGKDRKKINKANLEKELSEAELTMTQCNNKGGSNSLLQSYMAGDFMTKLYYCDSQELSVFLPIIAQTIANLPFGLTGYKNILAKILNARINDENDRLLDQSWRCFIFSWRDVSVIRHSWSQDSYFCEIGQMENDPIEHFDRIYEYLVKHGNEDSNEQVPLNKILKNSDYYLYDPIEGSKIESVSLVKVMKSNAKPLLIDLVSKKEGKASNNGNNSNDESENETENEKSRSKGKKKIKVEAKEDEYDSNFRLTTRVLLKKGDDLRKDSGVTLMFHIMNAIWNKAGLKTIDNVQIETVVYQCIPFTKDFGLIEFIPNCTAMRDMFQIPMVEQIMTQVAGKEKFESLKLKSANGKDENNEYLNDVPPSKASKASNASNGTRNEKSRADTVASRLEFMKQRSYDDMAEREKKFSRNLIATTAGSVIAGYIMGIRDRHSNNILISQESGKLFHIDFGYIMGETIKNGIDAPAIAITTDLYRFISVKSENDWNSFVNYCIQAFELLRGHYMELLDYVKIAFSFLKEENSAIDPEKFLMEKLMIDKDYSDAITQLKNELDLAPGSIQMKAKDAINKIALAMKG